MATNANKTSAKLPPFGKTVAEHPGANVIVYAGPGAWDAARNRTIPPNLALVLPDGEDPENFRWPVTGLWLTLVWPGATPAELQRFAHALLRAGAFRVTAICLSEPGGVISYRRPE